MKLTRRAKALLSIVLVITMLMSVAAIGLASVSAADALALSYSFKYKNAGYAEGRIRLTASSSADYGTYYLYWANDTKALDGYAEIATLNLNQDSKSFAMDEFTAIPADATKLIAIKSATAPTTKTVAAAQAVFDIPEDKQFKNSSSEMEYNFQALSDVHIDSGGFYTSAEHNFASALDAAAQRDAEFVTICGDLMNGNNGTANYEREWGMYLKVVAASSFTNPIYEANGNHETYADDGATSDLYDFGLNMYKIATGLNTKTEKMQNAPYYEITAPNGDHFIFMALELITKNQNPSISNTFTDEQLNWLEDLLEKYEGDGKRIFINEHAPFQGYGAGDNKETPHYTAALTDNYPNALRFKRLLEAHKDVILLSGHTHIDFKYKYNIDNEDGKTAYTVHIPSTASPTQVNASGGLDYPQSDETSQGYFVDVYDNYVVLNGTDLIKNQILPAYTYIIDYTGEELIEGDDIGGDDTYKKVDVTVDVSNLTQNAASVKLSLYGAEDDTITETVTMTKNADGTYTGKASTEFTKMKFVVNDGKNDIKTKEYEVANCKVVLGAIKVEYSNPSNWSFVNVYVWSNAGGDAVTWPGMAMQKNSSGKYVAAVPEGNDMVIFNNRVGDSGSKTDDLVITPYVTETIEGSYTIVETTEPETTVPVETTTVPVETSTAPIETTATDPVETSTAPVETSTAPTETSTVETTVTEPEVYLYGDADLDGKVTIKDATTVQKHAAQMLTLEGKAFIQANVTGDKAVNVRDSTSIQKFVALLITEFPVESKTKVVAVGASSSELTTLLSTVETTLGEGAGYASYDAYMALKKAYYTYKDQAVSSMSATQIDTAYAEINTALTNFNTMKKNNPNHISVVYNSGGEITIYFSNSYNWSTVKAYAWGSGGTKASWPGENMTFVRNNSSGQAIYSITLDYGSYQNIIFNDGANNQTVDISLTGEDSIGYYVSGGSGKSHTVSTYKYS